MYHRFVLLVGMRTEGARIGVEHSLRYEAILRTGHRVIAAWAPGICSEYDVTVRRALQLVTVSK